jgi:hypothetical protein
VTDFWSVIPGLSGVLVNVQTTFGETAGVAEKGRAIDETTGAPGKCRVIDAPVPEVTWALPFAVSTQR